MFFFLYCLYHREAEICSGTTGLARLRSKYHASQCISHRGYNLPARQAPQLLRDFYTKDGFTRLIDMNGNQVKVWAGRGMPGEMIDPALTTGERGHVFVGERAPDIQVSDVIRELGIL